MKKLFIFSLVCIVFLGCSKSISQHSNTDKIVFLNLKLVKGEVKLENIKIVNGKLKQPKRIHFYKDHLYYKVLNETDEKLYEGVIPDPAINNVEYVDENGQLRSKLVINDHVNFTVRFPYKDTIKQIDFKKITDITANEKEITKQTQNVGSITINLEGEKDEK